MACCSANHASKLCCLLIFFFAMAGRQSEIVTCLGSVGGNWVQASVYLHEALIEVDRDCLQRLACFTVRALQDSKKLHENEQFVLFLSLQGKKLFPLVVELTSASLHIDAAAMCRTLQEMACVERKADESLCVVLVTLNQDGSADSSLTRVSGPSGDVWKFRPVLDTTQLLVQDVAHVRYTK